MLPRTLKNLMLRRNGVSLGGATATVTLPKLARKLEEYRGAGMDTPIKLDMGGEALEMECTINGMAVELYRGFGGTLAGEMLNFTGAYEREDTGEIFAVDVFTRGRYEEIEAGEQKLGELNGTKAKLALAYYRLDVDGRTLVEIDPINGVMIVDGFDVLAAQRAAMGGF
ncbi:phage major tail tube protein [Sphingomonas sp.]|uniref:phage major tail tube protein n=1 Tax=Sphingomonas sp. TaxID=28214 RepID=UPI003B3A89C2